MIQLPHDFSEDTRHIFGEESYQKLLRSLSEDTPSSIRVNSQKVNDYAQFPITETIDAPVEWAHQAYYLQHRPSFTFDPHFHAGHYYVQEACSMYIEQAVQHYLNANHPVVALDLCAAPGGKSTHLRTILPKGSLLVSNEPMRNRAQVLAENIIKWGSDEVVVTQNYPEDFSTLPSLFDFILTDVPCSGEGMFRKDEQAISEWSRANVRLCQERQRNILRQIWHTLKSDGLLVYSTCTFNLQENEENVAWIAKTLGAEVLPLPTDEKWGVLPNQLNGESFPAYRFMPGFTRGEGFFMAILRKTGSTDENTNIVKRTPQRVKKNSRNDKKTNPSQTTPSVCYSWILEPERYEFMWQEQRVIALPKSNLPIIELLRRELNVLYAGVELGEMRGKDFLPAHALALSYGLNRDAFTTVELTYEMAIAYLRKEALPVSATISRGIILFTYLGVPLGFGKNVGNRANNLYPQEWRIRSTHTPAHWLNPEKM